MVINCFCFFLGVVGVSCLAFIAVGYCFIAQRWHSEKKRKDPFDLMLYLLEMSKSNPNKMCPVMGYHIVLYPQGTNGTNLYDDGFGCNTIHCGLSWTSGQNVNI
jgi:hypothetical protein